MLFSIKFNFSLSRFECWQFRFAFSVMTKATQNTNVGGLYSLLSLSLHAVGEKYYVKTEDAMEIDDVTERRKELDLILSYLEEIIFQCCQFQNDLLRARYSRNELVHRVNFK